jgi:hypothetical protein
LSFEEIAAELKDGVNVLSSALLELEGEVEESDLKFEELANLHSLGLLLDDFVDICFEEIENVDIFSETLDGLLES